MKIEKEKRQFVAENLEIDNWTKLLPYFENLVSREIGDVEEFEKWLRDKSELEAILEEDMAWRYIRMTIDTTNQEHADKYAFFVNEIMPNAAPFDDVLNKKLVSSEFLIELEKEEKYNIYFRSVRKNIELFREENIPLETEIQTKSAQYGTISAAQNIEWEGEQITMQKAANLLKNQDLGIRKSAYEKMHVRRQQDIEQLEQLFDELIQLRHQTAINAGFENYRDYKFEALGRFDYTKEDCFNFHDSVREFIVPIVRELQKEHVEKLGKISIQPWDTDVDPDGLDSLKPFENGSQLLEKSKLIFNQLDGYFGDCLLTMEEMNHLDLDSKTGKAPGGYNYPLYEIGVPFIFMNAAGAQRDVETMVHEGGHAVHSFLSRNLELTAFKNLPSEVAELASMSMELLSMKHWDAFYSDDKDLKRAVKEQLVGILKVLPWIATIDSFQHWIYTNPNHSREERKSHWEKLQSEYGNPFVDYSGFEEARSFAWQRQLHLYEVPFYYIEYGIAQLGALGIWKNSLNEEAKTLQQYKSALALGYTKSIPSIYEEAGIRFDFSSSYIKELADFISLKINELK